MTKKEKLIEKLKHIKSVYGGDPEAAHSRADEALLDYINSKEVTKEYNQIPRWYS